MTRELLEAINIQAKREGYFLPVLRAIVFEQLGQNYAAKHLLDILNDHRGGNWGADQSAELLPAPSLRSPDIRHGSIDFAQAEIRYYTPNELKKHRLAEIVDLLNSISDGEWRENTHFDIRLAKRANLVSDAFEKLEAEAVHQQSLLAKLKQAILQEAIQGKLTADWRAAHPDVEPASQLLHRIQAEKARLIAAKKFRPEKPLPKITPAEIPFEIPKGWEWCRFGSYARFERGKFSARPRNDKRFFGGPYPFIQIGSLDSHGSVITEFTQTLNDAGLEVSKMFEAGTIAVAIVGGTIGNLGVLGRDMCFTDSVVGVRPSKFTCQDFILLLMRSKQPEIQSVAYQRAGQPNISLPNLTDIVIPLPPLVEQAAIVERVEALMTTCRALEAEIEHARTHAAHLLQAVLKEAFAPASS